MKKTSAVLFILVFLLSLGGFNAHAQTQVRKTSFAFIPLISPGGDTSVPVELRARQAFDALASRLLQAQANGQIVQFEPEFDHALLKVEYQTGFDLAAALSVRPGATAPIFDNPKAVLDYARVGQVRPDIFMAPAQSDPVIWLGVYDACFQGENLGPNNIFMGYLYDNNMRLLSVRHDNISGSGDVDDCFNEGLWHDMIPGYTFTANIYDNTGTSLLHTYTTVIPRLNITAITPKSKTFKGIGIANDQIWFELVHYGLDASDSETFTYSGANTTSKGAWSLKLDPSVVMRAGDQVGIAWPNPDVITTTFIFYRYLWVPFLDCQLAGSFCSAYGVPGKSAKITLTHAGKNYKISGKSDYYGWFGGLFYDANTDPIIIRPGDKVVGTGAPTLYLPNLTAVPDTLADNISGLAPAYRWFEVDLDAFFHTSGWKSDWSWVESDAYGTYLADFSGSFAINTADIIEASVYYSDPVTGNETDYWNYVTNP